MAVSRTLSVLVFCIILCAQALEQRPPRGRQSKRDTLVSSMFSAFSNVDKRLAALEASWNNSTEERLAQLKAKVEEEMQEKQQHMEERLQIVQNDTQRLESMVLELLSSRLESMVTEILTSKMKSSEAKVAELVETKTNATEERLASLEASNTEAQSSPAACKYQFLYQYEKEAPHSSADSQRVAKLESELTRLQEKVSALDKRLQDNDLRVDTLRNASVLAMESMLHSMTELVAASERSLMSTTENATKLLYENIATMMNATFFTSMAASEQSLKSTIQNAIENLASTINFTEAQLFSKAEKNFAVLTASNTIVEQTTKKLETRLSTVEYILRNATSLHTEETERIKATLEDLKNKTEEMHSSPQYRRRCQDYYHDGQKTSGVYRLQLEDGQGLMDVYCDMSIGPGWVVFQRRQDGSVNFYRNWTSYEEGFGDLSGEFWLGNSNIHRLTSAGLTQLRVDLQAWNGSTVFAFYSYFSVGDAISSYMLLVSGYSGTAGDSLAIHSGQKFSTFDRDLDTYSGNCAQDFKGAWWYYSGCHYSNLNGLYGTRGSSSWQYVTWYPRLGLHSLQRTELKLK